MSDERQC
jgi:hypothetical protein